MDIKNHSQSAKEEGEGIGNVVFESMQETCDLQVNRRQTAKATLSLPSRSRSSCSESSQTLSTEGTRKRGMSETNGLNEDVCSANIYRKARSLYGAYPDIHFGPKASLLQSQESTLTIQDPGSQSLTWYRPPQNILIIKKIRDDQIDGPFVELVTYLCKEKKLTVYIEKKVLNDAGLASLLKEKEVDKVLCTFQEGVDDLTGKVDLIICLGGDGTLLYASSLFQESIPPVMAFHLGSLGFLSPFEFSDYRDKTSQVLEAWLAQYVIETLLNSSLSQVSEEVRLILRTRLKCDVVSRTDSIGVLDSPPKTLIRDIESPRHILALNEVVVDRGATPYLCQLDLYIQDKQVTVVQGDGLIISTPTGSTAYAAAAGASMVHPNVPAIIITPICPHSLSFRPIVVPAGVEIKITVSPDARDVAWISFDGRNRRKLGKEDVLVISTSKFPLPSVCHNDPISDWFESLAGCLHWNVRKSQGSLLNADDDDQ